MSGESPAGDRFPREPTRQQLVQQAIEMIHDGECLKTFGISQADLARETGRGGSSVSYWFTADSDGRPKVVLDEEVARYVAGRMEETARSMISNYEMAATSAERVLASADIAKFIRSLLKDAIVRDLDAYDKFARPYLLVLAVAERPGSSIPKIIRDAHGAAQRSYEPVYELFCELLGREFGPDGLNRTQRAINTYLEGVTTMRRYGAAPHIDEVVDTAMRLFWVTTRPIDGEWTDMDEEMARGARRNDASEPGEPGLEARPSA